MKEEIFAENIDLVAGRDGVNRDVRSISVMEVPDYPDGDVGRGMMILTTLSAYKNNIEAMVDAFRKLADKGISALVVKLNRLNPYMDVLPGELIDFANANDVPLFIISKVNLPFREIIFCVMTQLVNYKYSILLRVNQHYEELYDAIVKREGLADFVQRFSASTRLACICISSNGETLASSDRDHAFAPALISRLMEEIRLVEAESDANRPYARAGCMVFPAMLQDGIGGYFIVRMEHQLDEEEVFFCRQMVSFLSIKILEDYLLLESGQRASAITVDRILYGVVNDPEGLQLSLESLGFSHRGLMRILLIRDAARQNGSTLDASHYARFEHFKAYFRREFSGSVVHSFANGYIVFLALKQDMKLSVLKRKLLAALESPRVGSGFCLGCGAPVEKVGDIPKSFFGARSAVRFGHIFAPDERVHFQTDFLEVSAVSHLLGTAEHTAIKSNVISPIKRYDADHRSDLWTSLDVCISANSLKQAAETLSIHITTLRYRIKKIQDLTGIDYFNTNGRYLLQTASILDKIE
ncbi:PucR family transcriptional regulator [Rhodobium gokarnense]|uniref:Purine catabolism regulator n=1 Tax=Rhodobium gokarnense TaxID=364296 RepID=A0ABT3H7H4_9HYPH|nr:PucR family transcriptional regulator ligand-binding domain-containing protein [Rhodobium gokarnense]MCW2306340.1 purine catabolism regulator [Rhodobium gokarnense]